MTRADHHGAETGIALILAAGSGRRLGLGPKALLPWGGSVLVVRAVRAALAAGLRPVVTAGPGRTVIEHQLAGEDRSVRVVDVPDAETGMSASWRAGIDAISGLVAVTELTPVVVMLVDQPGVGSRVLQRLRSDFRPDAVVRAAWNGRAGHPVVMSMRNARAASETATGDEAARTWVREHRGLVRVVECGDLGDGADIDTPSDLREWERRRAAHG